MSRICCWHRGFSYWRLVNRYSRSSNVCANGLAAAILRRYLRTTKFTCIDRRESIERINDLISRLGQRHNCTYHIHDLVLLHRCERDEVWIGGEMTLVDGRRMRSLKRLYGLVEKTERLVRG